MKQIEANVTEPTIVAYDERATFAGRPYLLFAKLNGEPGYDAVPID